MLRIKQRTDSNTIAPIITSAVDDPKSRPRSGRAFTKHIAAILFVIMHPQLSVAAWKSDVRAELILPIRRVVIQLAFKSIPDVFRLVAQRLRPPLRSIIASRRTPSANPGSRCTRSSSGHGAQSRPSFAAIDFAKSCAAQSNRTHRQYRTSACSVPQLIQMQTRVQEASPTLPQSQVDHAHSAPHRAIAKIFLNPRVPAAVC